VWVIAAAVHGAEAHLRKGQTQEHSSPYLRFM